MCWIFPPKVREMMADEPNRDSASESMTQDKMCESSVQSSVVSSAATRGLTDCEIRLEEQSNDLIRRIQSSNPRPPSDMCTILTYTLQKTEDEIAECEDAIERIRNEWVNTKMHQINLEVKLSEYVRRYEKARFTNVFARNKARDLERAV